LRRVITVLIFSLLLIGLVISIFEVRSVKTESTIIVPDDYLTIQEAIDAASNGDTIFVRNGTYFENLVIEKPLTLIGESKEATIVDAGGGYGAGSGYALRLRSSNIHIARFSIRNMLLGVIFQVGNQSTIENCNILGSGPDTTFWGIYLGYESHNNTVIGNYVKSCWRGIFLESSSYNTVIQNVVMNNNYGIPVANVGTFPENPFPPLSMHNTIYHNNLIYNGVQAIDSGWSNAWDNGSAGNYWSNYNGIDSNGDGIGDTYLPWEGVDDYPLINHYWWNPADINFDLIVDIFDVITGCDAYSSTYSDLNWNSLCDIVEPFGLVNIFDIVMICQSYGEEYTP